MRVLLLLLLTLPSLAQDIHLAAMTNNVAAVERILRDDPDALDRADQHGDTPLIAALSTQYDRFEVAQLLIQHGADVNRPNFRGTRALHYAAERGSLRVVRLLLEHGADVNVVDEQNRNPLSQAAFAVFIGRENAREIGRLLLARGATADFEAAVAFGLVDRVAELIRQDPKLRDKQLFYAWTTPFYAAGMAQQPAVAELFAPRDRPLGIFEAIVLGRVERLREVLRDPRMKGAIGPRGYSPLQWAVIAGQIPAADVLLASGFDVNQKFRWGETTLHLAARRGDLRMTEYLLAHGADPRAANYVTYSPARTARIYGHTAVADLLDSRSQEPIVRSQRKIDNAEGAPFKRSAAAESLGGHRASQPNQ